VFFFHFLVFFPSLETYPVIAQSQVARPSDYIWENVSLDATTRALKVTASNFLTLAILVVGFTCIIAAKGVEASAKLRIGTTDCTQCVT